ncbi:MAG: AAA family ATPase [Paracoccaceae bacterium]
MSLPVLDFEPAEGSMKTLEKVLRYANLGFPVHLCGPSGVGKTATAIEAARRIGRPISFFTGNSGQDPSSLVGSVSGKVSHNVVDRYISSVRKTTSNERQLWVDESLSVACLEGHTLIFDEFHRSPPEATSPLLSVLEERILVLPRKAHETPVIPVHPEFRLILTSNSTDASDTSDVLNALYDRIVTLEVNMPDTSSETRILVSSTGVSEADANRILELLGRLRKDERCRSAPSLRAAQMIGKAVVEFDLDTSLDDPDFVELCKDILGSKIAHDTKAKLTREEVILRALKVSKAKSA